MYQNNQPPGPPNPINPFSGLTTATISPKGNPFLNGTYKVDFIRALLKQTQRVGLAFIVEYKLLESNHPAHPVGSIASWFQKMQNQAVAFSAIAGWYAAHLGYDNSPQAMQHFDANVRPHLETLVAGLVQNPAALQGHTTVELNVKTVPTKNTGMPFQLHTFRPWKPSQGWQPQPTPAQPAEPQAPPRAMPATGNPMAGFAGGAPQQPGAYPQAPYGAPAGQQYGAPPQAPMYGQPPQQAPYGQPPQAAPMTAPYGAPGMPPAGPSPYGQPPQQAPAPAPYGVPGPGAPPTGPGWPQR